METSLRLPVTLQMNLPVSARHRRPIRICKGVFWGAYSSHHTIMKAEWLAKTEIRLKLQRTMADNMD